MRLVREVGIVLAETVLEVPEKLNLLLFAASRPLWISRRTVNSVGGFHNLLQLASLVDFAQVPRIHQSYATLTSVLFAFP